MKIGLSTEEAAVLLIDGVVTSIKRWPVDTTEAAEMALQDQCIQALENVIDSEWKLKGGGLRVCPRNGKFAAMVKASGMDQFLTP